MGNPGVPLVHQGVWELESGKGDMRSQGKDGTKRPQITLRSRSAGLRAEAAPI